jgi:hypothetical protein
MIWSDMAAFVDVTVLSFVELCCVRQAGSKITTSTNNESATDDDLSIARILVSTDRCLKSSRW